MSGPAHDDELTAFQAALANLTPTPEGVNIARLLFLAGAISAARRGWAWPCTTGASTLLAAALGAVLLLRPTAQTVERFVEVYVQPTTPPVLRTEPLVANQPSAADAAPGTFPNTERPQNDGHYLQIRQQVLAKGVEALPPPAPWPAAAQRDPPDILHDIPRGARESGFLRPKHSVQSGDAL